MFSASRVCAPGLALLLCLACAHPADDSTSGPPQSGSVLVVANAGPKGALLRRTPGGELVVIGPDVLERGRTWTKVRAPDGDDGWISEELATFQGSRPADR